jgi:hypothetical protein
MVSFRKPLKYEDTGYYREARVREQMTDADVAHIEESIKHLDLGPMKKAKEKTSFSLAFEDMASAFMVKMAVMKLEAVVLDVQTMQEAVEAA